MAGWGLHSLWMGARPHAPLLPTNPVPHQEASCGVLEANQRTTIDVTTDTDLAQLQEAEALAFSRQLGVHWWSVYPERMLAE